jgi:hypothetical protein
VSDQDVIQFQAFVTNGVVGGAGSELSQIRFADASTWSAQDIL